MKRSHRVFLAIPFDAATKQMYSRISNHLKKRYPSVTTVMGNTEVGPSRVMSDIASFRDQNLELNRQFVAQINEADVVVADLTHNNPNVHVELGVAIMKNKNILRVTGRSVSDLGFDIQNLEAFAYRTEDDLRNKICNYLDTFFKIKKLPLSGKYGDLYWRTPTPIKLRRKEPAPIDLQDPCPKGYVLRDGGLRVEFEFGQATPPDNWFGIFLRAGSVPFMGSHLVYVRPDGRIEIAVYPGPRVFRIIDTKNAMVGRKIMNIQFENNVIEVGLDNTTLSSDGLAHQVAGRVLVAAWHADVTVHDLRMICRDTVRWA